MLKHSDFQSFLAKNPNFSSMFQIGSYLYSMMSSIYSHQLKDANSMQKPNFSIEEIPTSALLLEETVDISGISSFFPEKNLSFFSEKNSNFFTEKNSSFLTEKNSRFFSEQSLKKPENSNEFSSLDRLKDSFTMDSSPDPEVFLKEIAIKSDDSHIDDFFAFYLNEIDERSDLDRNSQNFIEKKSIDKIKNRFLCNYCSHISQTKQQLGGHVSRKHRGKGVSSLKRKNANFNKEYKRKKNSVLRENSRISMNFS